jgi:hypothetical protein
VTSRCLIQGIAILILRVGYGTGDQRVLCRSELRPSDRPATELSQRGQSGRSRGSMHHWTTLPFREVNKKQV